MQEAPQQTNNAAIKIRMTTFWRVLSTVLPLGSRPGSGASVSRLSRPLISRPSVLRPSIIPSMPRPSTPEEAGDLHQRKSNRDSWTTKQARYNCQVVHPCQPPAAVTYFSFPFFTLSEGEVYGVIQEAGHPSLHSRLPLYVDDGEDCLLLCRDEGGNIGWALASFLVPVSID